MANPLKRTFALYKASYSDHPREIWVLALMTLLNRMGTMVMPFLSVYLTTQLNFELKAAGWLVTAFGLGSFLGSWAGGKLTSKIGANHVIVLSLVVSGGLFILMQFMTTFWGFFGLLFLTATFGEAYRPAMMVAAANVVPSSKMGRTTSLLRIAINLGMAAGPAIGGFIAATISYQWLFWIDGLTCIFSGLIFFFIARSWPSTVESIDENTADENGKPLLQLSPWRNKQFLLYLGATFLLGFVFLQIIHLVPVFVKGEWGFDERVIGSMFALSCILVVLIEMPVVHWIEHRKQIRLALAIGAVVIGISYLVFLLPKALFLCYVMIVLWTLGEILNLPFNNSVAMNMSPPSRRGDYMSGYWMVWSMVHIVGPPLGFGFVDTFGFGPFWIVLATIGGITLFLFWRLTDKVVE